MNLIKYFIFLIIKMKKIYLKNKKFEQEIKKLCFLAIKIKPLIHEFTNLIFKNFKTCLTLRYIS